MYSNPGISSYILTARVVDIAVLIFMNYPDPQPLRTLISNYMLFVSSTISCVAMVTFWWRRREAEGSDFSLPPSLTLPHNPPMGEEPADLKTLALSSDTK